MKSDLEPEYLLKHGIDAIVWLLVERGIITLDEFAEQFKKIKEAHVKRIKMEVGKLVIGGPLEPK